MMNLIAKLCTVGQTVFWFFSDTNRVIATFTVVLAVIGLCALRIAADTERRQLRAYMVVEFASVTRIQVGQNIEAEVIIKNTGQTPAYNITGFTGIMADQLPLGHSFPEIKTHNLATTIVGAGGVVRSRLPTRGGALTNEILAKINAGTAAVYVMGKITYTDAFRVSRFLKYRLYMTKLAETSGLFQPVDVEGNGGN